MRITGKLIMMAVTALCVASCAKDTELFFDDNGVPLQITAVKCAGTKAGLDDTDFMENDRIGLFLTGYSGKYRNVSATGTGSGPGTAVTQWTLNENIQLNKEKTQVLAYYPYNDAITGLSVNIDADEQVDFLFGNADNVSGSNPEARITFRHAMARLRLAVSYFDENSELAVIKINGVNNHCVLDLSTGVLSGFSGNGITIVQADRMPFASEHIYDVLLFPMSATTATLSLTFSDGNTYATIVSLPAMSSGDYNILPITIREGSQPITGSHEYVDLGLSVKWATCNVGATAPEGYGDYFAWGATEPWYQPGYAQSSSPVWKSGKSAGYTWKNTPYQTANTTSYSSTKWAKYLGSTTSSYKDASATSADALKTVLDPADDAARANWGGSWRMPTKAEQDELRNTDNCTWTWTTMNGVNGYKVVSKKSGYAGNWIFLPAAGYRLDTSLNNVGSYGYYWSSSLYTSNPNNAYYLYFNSSNVDWRSNYRYYGHSVRPVCP